MPIIPQKVPFAPSPTLVAAVTEAAQGRRPVQWFQRVGGGGYTPAHRLLVVFADGSTAFVKAAVDTRTAAWIRAELRVYQSLGRQSFLPAFFGGAEGDDAFPESTVLLLEDLSECFWPPPWTTERINAVLEALQAVHNAASLSSLHLPTLTQSLVGEPSWAQVAADPAPFLALEFCSSSWLEKALPLLLETAALVPSDGVDLLHQDIRSDNLCFRADGSAVFVDWNWACIGNGAFDIAAWASSLHAEGGPLPDVLLPDAAEFSAWLSGFWARQAGLPPPSGAPRVRAVQYQQLTVALPWVVRVLGLPPLDRKFTV